MPGHKRQGVLLDCPQGFDEEGGYRLRGVRSCCVYSTPLRFPSDMVPSLYFRASVLVGFAMIDFCHKPMILLWNSNCRQELLLPRDHWVVQRTVMSASSKKKPTKKLLGHSTILHLISPSWMFKVETILQVAKASS